MCIYIYVCVYIYTNIYINVFREPSNFEWQEETVDFR